MSDSVDISILLDTFNQLQRRGVSYIYGGKADLKSTNPRSAGRLSTPLDTIDGLDCSGFTRYSLYRAAGWLIPDGSQEQRAWFQEEFGNALAAYSDVNANVGRDALYIAFIKPNVNGCGDIGHVWFVYKQADGIEAETIECHGGGGVDSRSWNTVVLLREAYVAYPLTLE